MTTSFAPAAAPAPMAMPFAPVADAPFPSATLSSPAAAASAPTATPPEVAATGAGRLVRSRPLTASSALTAYTLPPMMTLVPRVVRSESPR